jgi:hypothetical protein
MSKANSETSSHGNVSTDEILGRLTAVGWHTSSYYRAASIDFLVDAAPGAQDMPGRIVFRTSDDGAMVPTEKARINSAGHFQMRSDTGRVQLGASQDLELYHDGTNSYVENNTGELFINSTTGVTLELSDGTNLARLTSGTYVFGDGVGQEQMFLDGAAATVRDLVWQSASSNRWILRVNSIAESGSNAGSDFEILSRTDAGAALFTALKIVRSTGYTRIPADSLRLQFGASEDLELYHDGTNSYIENNTGRLILKIDGGSMVISDDQTQGSASVTSFTKYVSLSDSLGGAVLGYELYNPEGTNNTRLVMFLDDTNNLVGFNLSGSTGLPDFVIQRAGVTKFIVEDSSNADVHVGDGSTAAIFRIDGAAATSRTLGFYTDASLRWAWQVDTTAESGSNAGSNCSLLARADDGTALFTVLAAIRSTGQLRSLDGTVGVPQYSFSSDTDLGMYRVAANVLGLAASSGVQIENALPALWFVETDQAADGQAWRVASSGGAFGIIAFNDAKSTSRSALSFTRSGNAVTNVNFGNTTDNPAYTFHGTGTVAFGGVLNVTGNINIANDTGLLRLGASADLTLTHDGTNSIIANATGQLQFKDGANVAAAIDNGAFAVTDGITAPTAIVGLAFIYVDTADGDLKVRFGDGTTKTIATDT